MRINQFIAQKKNLSRRQVDRLIVKKRVKINSRLAVLGDRVQKNDRVYLNDELLTQKKKMVYLAFNKPVGIVSNIAHKGQKGINDVLIFPIQVFPVGRLDKNSHGLIFLTNDGRVTERLLHPKQKHEKEYIVKVSKPITEDFMSQMRRGVVIDGYRTKKCEIKQINQSTNKKIFKIILTEGKKRQIRKMCSKLDYKVVDLQRVRIMSIRLGNLKRGKYRELKNKELEKFLNDLKIEN